jgi:hypothetical protein
MAFVSWRNLPMARNTRRPIAARTTKIYCQSDTDTTRASYGGSNDRGNAEDHHQQGRIRAISVPE